MRAKCSFKQPGMFSTPFFEGGDPFVNFKLHSFNVKCSQNLVNLGTHFLFTILIQKLRQVSASILFSSPPCFSFLVYTVLWSLVNFKLHSGNVAKNMSIWETYFFPQLWSKSYSRSVFLRVFACLLFCSYPCFIFFLWCLFGLPSTISCRNPYIEYGWTSYICQCNDCLKFGNSWGGPFCELQIPFF